MPSRNQSRHCLPGEREPAKVRCRTCYHDHDFRHEQAPPSKKDLKKAELFKEVLAAAVPGAPPSRTAPIEPPPEPEPPPKPAKKAQRAASGRERLGRSPLPRPTFFRLALRRQFARVAESAALANAFSTSAAAPANSLRRSPDRAPPLSDWTSRRRCWPKPARIIRILNSSWVTRPASIFPNHLMRSSRTPSCIG